MNLSEGNNSVVIEEHYLPPSSLYDQNEGTESWEMYVSLLSL